jgi:hypothetical protein
VDLVDVSSMFAMEQIKYTTALPLTQVNLDWRLQVRDLRF